MNQDEDTYASCESLSATCPPHIRKWRNEIKRWSASNETEKIERVNSWVNRTIRYTEDRATFGRKDFWASPTQSLKGRGDCEDYAIAKYASLRALGFSEDRLRIVIVNDTRKKIGHAILSVRTSTGVFILDNQNARPLLHEKINYYAPVYSINAAGRWINIATRQIKSRYDVAYEKNGDPALAAKAEKSFELASTTLVRASDAELPIELLLRPTTAAGELEPLAFSREDFPQPARTRTSHRH